MINAFKDHAERQLRGLCLRVGRWFLGRSDASFFKKLGGSALRYSGRDWLRFAESKWTSEHVAEVFARSRAHEAILTQALPDDISLAEILDAVDDQALILPASRLIVESGSPRAKERDAALFEAIRLSSSERGAASLVTALNVVQRVSLNVVQRVSGSITTDHARGILETCLIHSEQPIDPYHLNQIGNEARMAAASLITAHPELDETVLERLRNGASPYLEAVVARGFTDRTMGQSEAIASAVAAIRPSRESAVDFGRRCDTRYSSADPVHQPRETHLRLLGRRMVVWIRPLVPWILGPLGIVMLAAAIESMDWSTDIELSTAELLTMLGVLVAVHVVSAELSSNRLPGVLARRTNTPWALSLAYAVLLSLLFARSLGEGVPEIIESSRSGEALLVGGLTFAILLYISITLLIARTDPANAAERYAAVRRNALERSGFRLGEIQRQSADARVTISAIPYIRLESSASVAERRSKVPAWRRGIRHLSIARLRSLERRPRWSSGMLTLTFLLSPGTSVRAGEELGSIAAAPQTSVTARDYRQGRRVFRILEPRAIDEAAESTAALINSAQDLASRGDITSAQRVASAFRSVLETHITAARRSRRKHPTEAAPNEDNPYPSIPAVRVAADSLMERLSVPCSETEREVLVDMVRQLVEVSGPEEHAAFVVALKAKEVIVNGGAEITGTHILATCSETALDNDDSTTLSQVQSALEQTLLNSSGQTRPYVLESSSQIAAAATWKDYFRSHDFWKWFWQSTARCNDQPAGRLLGALRVGAAAMLADNYSLAIEIALDVSEESNPQALEGWMQNQTVAVREQTFSHMFGRYLGADAEASLREFTRFAAKVFQSVPDDPLN